MTSKLVVAVVLVLAAAGGYWFQQSRHADPPAVSAPDGHVAFALPDLEGNLRDLSEWEGKARLVNFWATWCAPCRREIPLLKNVQAEHGTALQVIGVAVDYQEDVEAYAETAQFNYPILIGQDDAVAAAETSGQEFVGLPVTMLISADGDLIKLHMGEIFEDHIEQIVEVVQRMERGELDLAGARATLGRL